MEGIVPILILSAVFCLLCGPVALAVSLYALSRVKRLERKRSTATPPLTSDRSVEPAAAPAPTVTKPVLPVTPESPPEPVTPAKPPSPPREQRTIAASEPVSLEQRIGTRWVLIAGVVTVIFAVGFFLKYAYDNQWIGPLGRVTVAAIGGLLALGVGEFTRRRGYGVAAKGVTALGFAILYATVFAAHRWYGLLETTPAFALAVIVTTAAMLYAVSVEEVVAALLALLGGYITPVVVSTGQNHPNALFSYVLILSAGAMLCAAWRKWPPVNILAFLGTFALYTGWFEKFYRPEITASGSPDQMAVALFWLAVFFVVYLLLPILNPLVRQVRSQTSDVVLLLANAAVVFYYLWTIQIEGHRTSLALCCLGLGAAHLGLTGVVSLRCRTDESLRQSLLAIGLACVTVAIPFYLKMYAVAVTWAVEGVVLTVIGLRYRSVLTRIGGGVALALAAAQLLMQLPLHSEAFRPLLNPAFGTWCFVAAAFLAGHVLYRVDRRPGDLTGLITESLYIAGLLVLLAGMALELWHHGALNFTGGHETLFLKHIVTILAAFTLLLLARPVRPPGQLAPAVAVLIATAGFLCIVAAFATIHRAAFVVFLNAHFIRVVLFIGTLFAGAWLLQRSDRTEPRGFVPPAFMLMAGIMLLWIVLAQEIWHYWRCVDRYRAGMVNWRLAAQMYISMTWAVYAIVLMVVGFWRQVRLLRYVALAMFVLLLGKIFLWDTRTLESVYRIAGFLVTGLALVGVSYLYQFLRKKGFFERTPTDESADAHGRT